MSERLILGLETSCDDTSVCLLKTNNEHFTLLDLSSYNQDQLLSPWGGVVPEISARQHAETIPLVLKESFKKAQINLNQITDIAVTTNPGLIGSLLTGLQAGKVISLLQKIPITPVNHLFAHLESIHFTQKINYPYLGLLVSGGHTQIYWVENKNYFLILGETLDDAAGEAFDKGGKLMGLPYPSGRYIDEFALKGNNKKYEFPISLIKDRPGKMSFSGIKTSLRYFLEKNPELKNKNSTDFFDLCASYQESIVGTLVLKLDEVIRKLLPTQTQNFPIVVGGGVACNSYLRKRLRELYSQCFFVEPKYCTDNAAMIAMYAHLHPELKISFPQCLELDAKSSSL